LNGNDEAEVRKELIEKYVVFTAKYGMVEAPYWCGTVEEAKRERNKRLKMGLQEDETVYVCEVLEVVES